MIPIEPEATALITSTINLPAFCKFDTNIGKLIIDLPYSLNTGDYYFSIKYSDGVNFITQPYSFKVINNPPAYGVSPTTSLGPYKVGNSYSIIINPPIDPEGNNLAISFSKTSADYQIKFSYFDGYHNLNYSYNFKLENNPPNFSTVPINFLSTIDVGATF